MNLKHFLALYDGHRYDPVIVCYISLDLAAQLGSKRGRVLLSHDTMVKQRANHPDLTPENYKALAPCVMMGEYRQDTPRSATILFTDVHMGNCNYRAAIKATADGRRLYCLSFNLLRDRHLMKARRSGFPIIKQHD